MVFNQKKVERAALLAGILANRTRVSIILFLHESKGAYVREIVEEIDISQSAISHQLALLVEDGIVTFQKDGRDVFYKLTNKPFSTRLLKALLSL